MHKSGSERSPTKLKRENINWTHIKCWFITRTCTREYIYQLILLEEIIKPTQVLINKNEERANGLVQEILEPDKFESHCCS